MNNVLIWIGLILAVVSGGSTARADPLCALGWICETATEFELLNPLVEHGATSPTCHLRQIAVLRQQKLGFWLVTSAYRLGSTVELSFVVGLFQANPDGSTGKVAVRTARLLSADRVIDTADWAQTMDPESGMVSLSQYGTDISDPLAHAALAVASGARYGALVETESGRRFQLEIEIGTRKDASKLAIRAFRACVERDRLSPTAPKVAE